MTVRAITFDFWGTLFQDSASEVRKQSRVATFCRMTGADPVEAAEILDRTYREFFRIHIEEQRTLTPDDAVRMCCAAVGVELAQDAAAELSRAFATAVLEFPPEPIEGALDAVRAAARQFPVGLISDSGISPGSSLRGLLERFGFVEHFAVLTFSDEVGVAKPQAPMFERTARALNVPPADLLHIGDLEPTDIAGVQALGGRAALFAGVNTRFLDTTRAENILTHWREFHGLLERLG
jgi:putative hydrolase of the HAD superfamily